MAFKIEIIGLVAVISIIAGVNCQAAICNVEVNSDLPESDKQPIGGTVTFTTESDGNVLVDIDLSGFNTTDNEDVHGFHIHELGDLSNGCTSTGSHYNPENVDHAGRLNDTRHVGDLGNIEEDADGNVKTSFTDEIIKLDGANSVMDRAVVIHATRDDLGVSGDAAGAAGPRLGCCVITTDPNSSATGVHASLTILMVACISSILNYFN